MGDLGWNRGLGHTVNSPGHDGGAKPRQEFAGGAAQDGTRGAMASGAPVWARRRRAAGARAPAIALFRGALQISHASIRPHVAHYAPFLRAGHSHLAGVPADAFSACAARSAHLRTAGSICSPGSGARADPLWPCGLRRLPSCSEPGQGIFAEGWSGLPTRIAAGPTATVGTRQVCSCTLPRRRFWYLCAASSASRCPPS